MKLAFVHMMVNFICQRNWAGELTQISGQMSFCVFS